MKQFSVCLAVGLLLLFWGPHFLIAEEHSSDDGTAETLRAVQVAGPINPVVADFVTTELAAANQAAARAFLIQLDTPGGLDTAMREIIRSLLSSEIPVIVYVYPPGARAASAGALITLAADFAVMAPGTNIGAATPVSLGGGPADQSQDSPMQTKILNDATAYARSLAEQRGRNVDWAERIVRDGISTAANQARELRVVDLVAANLSALMTELDGRTYLRNGQARQLQLAGAAVRYAEMTLRQQILDAISSPTVAYLLLMLGILGIFFEISQPGVILPGAVGAIALLLAFYALQTMPVSFAGILLIFLSVVLFLLEIKVTSFGMLTVGGAVALGFGSLILIDSPAPYLQISRTVILATVIVVTGTISGVLYLVVRAQRSRFHSGREGLVGERGRAVTTISGTGTAFVHGEYWQAFAEEEIAEGESVEVVGLVSSMRLKVRKIEGDV
ncbi:MAG TPA: nodulation protein NfeD [Desulfuromonadales bacterium]|nr:nodulation protein NfeD [Desulfuromonadales bacterium]